MREFLGRPTCPRWCALDHIVTLPTLRQVPVLSPTAESNAGVRVTDCIDEPDEGVL